MKPINLKFLSAYQLLTMVYENTSDVNRWWLLPESSISMDVAYENGRFSDSFRSSTIRFHYDERVIKEYGENNPAFLYWNAFRRGEEKVDMRVKPVHRPVMGLDNTDVEFSVGSGQIRTIRWFEKGFEYWADILNAVGESQKVPAKVL